MQDYEGNRIATPVTDSAESDRIIDFWLKAAQAGWGVRWAVSDKHTNEFLGTIGFNSLTDYFEIAFHLHPDYWGRGVMSSASRLIVEWAKQQGATGLEAFVDPDNASSQTLLLRLGLKPTTEFSEGAERYAVSFT